MLRPYNNKRHTIFQLLDNLTIMPSTHDKAIEMALKFIRHYRNSHKEWITIDNNTICPELNLLSEGWFKVVTGLKKEKNISVRKVHRHYYEMAILTLLMGDLNCGDVYVEGAFIFDDPNKQLITWKQFSAEVDNYCDLVKLPKWPKQFINLLQDKLRKILVLLSMIRKIFLQFNHIVMVKFQKFIRLDLSAIAMLLAMTHSFVVCCG